MYQILKDLPLFNEPDPAGPDEEKSATPVAKAPVAEKPKKTVEKKAPAPKGAKTVAPKNPRKAS